MIELREARARGPRWDAERSARVLLAIHARRKERARARALSITLSSLAGMVLIVLAARALGGGPGHAPGPLTYTDAGAREN